MFLQGKYQLKSPLEREKEGYRKKEIQSTADKKRKDAHWGLIRKDK